MIFFVYLCQIDFAVKHFISYILILSVCLFACCHKESNRSNIPYEYVNFSINPSIIDFQLNVIGGWKYFDQEGYNGIFIYRLSDDEFLAYDRASPENYHHQVIYDGIWLLDSASGIQYNLLDGSPVNRSGKSPLQKYNVYPSGNYTWRVTN